MARKCVCYRIDDRLIGALKCKAAQSRSSVNAWVESLLIEVLRDEGFLPHDFEPLGETRGGARASGRKKSVN